MNTNPLPRPITQKLLDEFVAWTRDAPMFASSPEGAGFGEELRAVFILAGRALQIRPPDEAPALREWCAAIARERGLRAHPDFRWLAEEIADAIEEEGKHGPASSG